MALFGLLNLNKPKGVTSRRVVDQAQRLTRPAKAGHAGTLDPFARGVLIVCVGQATRLIEYLHRLPKRYVATFQLGQRSDTEDVEGRVTPLENPPRPTLRQIEQTAAGLLGEIQQVPPAYSALKVQGQRAYDLARAGERVELAARPVVIHAIEVLEYAYPSLCLEVCCGSGTYIRSLGRDLAEALETGAVMSNLTRTAIGDFLIDDAVDPASLTRENLSRHLLPPQLAVASLPSLELTPAQFAQIRHGRAILAPADSKAEEFAGLDSSGQLAAILKRSEHDELRPGQTSQRRTNPAN